ncbi:hypothetical protein [Polluticoccus soli]|uniref:hypothetical protein n=1 Tax=Polluticoccus soli TaxID=3034150 RepID=UPI0023E2946D|nr:hypothetical protein [Flavipsychrobacter sp. JY13-12]
MVIAFFVGIRKKWLAAAATLLPCLMIIGYVNKVTDNTDRDQAVPVFSAFGGWQLANNALHIIPHIDLSEPLVYSDDPDVRMVDSIVRYSYPAFKSKYPSANEVSYQAIWIDSLPLRQAMYKKRQLTRWDYYHAWNHMGLVYSEYGKSLITKHPYEYFRYYLYNNFQKLIKPETEVFENYLYGSSTGKYEREWFELNKHIGKQENMKPAHDLLRAVLKKQAWVYPVLWVLFCLSIASFLILLRKKTGIINSEIASMSAVLITFIAIYAAAIVYGAPVMLRFMMPIRLCIIAFVIICIQLIAAYYKQRKQQVNITPSKKMRTYTSEYVKEK